MRSLFTVILSLAALLGHDVQAAPIPPGKGDKKDDIVKQLQAAEQQLSAPDEATRRAALKELGRCYCGFDHVATRVGLVLVHDSSEELRLQAADVLQGMGPSAHRAVPYLAKALKDKSRKVRIKATEALMQIGPCAKDAVPALLEALKSKDIFFRRKVMTALSLIGPPKYPDEAVRAIVRAMKEKDDLEDRTQARVPPVAAIALGNYGPAAVAAVPELLELTRSPDMEMRGHALVTLGKIRAQPQVVVPLLLRFLNDKDQAAMRLAAVGGLASMGPLAKEAAPSLFKAFACEDIKDNRQKEWVRSYILRALVNIRADVPRVVALLIEVFQDKEGKYKDGLRIDAVRHFGQLGPAAAKAVPLLIDALKDVRRNAANVEILTSALAEIGEPAIGPLLKELKGTNPYVLSSMVRALGKMGPKAAAAVPAVRELTQHPDRGVASEAKYWLRHIEGP